MKIQQEDEDNVIDEDKVFVEDEVLDDDNERFQSFKNSCLL